MIVYVDPAIKTDDVIESLNQADQYDDINLDDPELRVDIESILRGVDGKDHSLMSLMQSIQELADFTWMSLVPTQYGFLDGVGTIKFKHPVILIQFANVPSELAILELDDKLYITMDYINVKA